MPFIESVMAAQIDGRQFGIVPLQAVAGLTRQPFRLAVRGREDDIGGRKLRVWTAIPDPSQAMWTVRV